MQLSPRDMSLIAIGTAVVGLYAYMAYSRSQETGQPRYESGNDINVATGFNVIDRLDTGSHYFHPVYCVPGQTQIFTPHRYPMVSGGQISTIIHQGFDALRRPAPQDVDWIERPPGEVMW